MSNPPPVKPDLADPVDSNMRIAYLLTAVRTQLMQNLDGELSEFSMTAAQFVILRRIADGSARTAAELCRALSYDTGSMTRMLDRLEEKALIARERSPDDRRIVHIQLTPMGAELFPKLRERASQAFQKKLAVFEPAELEQFAAYLKRLAGVV